MTFSLMDLAARMRGRTLLWDGGVGTALLARGLDLSAEPPEAWLLRRPDEVRAVHQAFARAGADVVQTNTFGLPRLLAQPRPAEWLKIEEIVPLAVDLARGEAAVVASLGPSGRDQPDEGWVCDTHARLARAFQAAGVAAIHLETCMHPGETAAAMRGVRQGAPGLTLVVSITLNVGNSGLETPLGAPLAKLLKVMERERPDAVGVNCSQHARRMRASVEALARWAEGRLPVLAQPQASETGPACKGRPAPETSALFAQALLGLREAGADALGGCCGITAADLAEVRRALGAKEEV